MADNGGPTRTMLPLAGSPTVDAAGPVAAAGLPFDQRRLAWVSGPSADLGAVEVQRSPLKGVDPPLVGDTDA